jgi:uncharacterized protein YecE (DUF72 family)
MIRVGVGGWNFPPWRGTFYPKGLPQAQELKHASSRLTSIEINGTFYRTQTPATFRKWAAEVPDGFVFAVKGPSYISNRSDLTAGEASVARFFESGVTELGDKLGPILWQLSPRKFDKDQIAGFLQLLPRIYDGRLIRHVLEVRHSSFRTPEFLELMRQANVPVVYAHSEKYVEIPDLTGEFVYARLQRSSEAHETGYPPDELDRWAKRFTTWGEGGEPDDLPRISAEPAPGAKPRDCFVYFISAAKERNPAAAMALIERLGGAR